jgi:hypothetical protein
MGGGGLALRRSRAVQDASAIDSRRESPASAADSQRAKLVA